MDLWVYFLTVVVVGALYDSPTVISAVKQKIGDDNKAYIRVLLPESDVYPESGVHRTAEIAKERIEKTHANISVNITLFQGLDSNEKLILDSEITKPLFQNAQENTYYVGLAHSKTALEMTTFLKMPTITFSTLFYIDEGTQVPINPQYRNSTKGLFNLLNHFKWYRVNFVFSHLPWYEETRKQLDASIKMLNNRRGSDTDNPILDGNIETRTKPSEEEYFYLNTHKMTEDDFREHIERSQTANIFVFVGHMCEFRQYIITASKYGFLKPGKIVIYLDMYGQMIEDKHDQGFTLSNVSCSNFFSKIPDYQDDFDNLLKAMKYVIVALTHWTDLPVNNVDRDRFEEDFQLDTTLDYSGFDILMADSLQLLQGFITRGNKSEDLPTFINNNQDSLSLYSGKLKYDNSVWRSLVCGVRFFHGNGFLEFMKWENTCNGIYCPEFTDTAKTVQWAGGDIPISRFDEKDSGPDSLLIILPLIFALFTIIAGAILTTQMYKKRKCASSQKLWCLDQKNFEISKTHALQPKLSHGGVFPKRYQNVKNKSSRYKNCEVFMKEISKVNLNISNNYELTTEILKRVGGKADNVNFLIGVLEKANNVLLVQPFCSNGSLMDVMQQNPMNILDNFDFKLHVLMDVCKGMCFLHDTLNIPHANLKTSNCLVDSRWTVKVSDFNPHRVKQVVQPDTSDKEHVLAQKLWTAPELLSSKYTAQRGLKLCDVYSFGMISYHVLAGALPYHCKGEEGELAFSEIITRVKERSEPPFRPQLKLSDCNDNDDICKLIKECWSQRPNLRPTFGKIAQILDGWAMPGQSFGDFIASQMEEYSYGLDQKVKEMEEKLEHERSEFERLLQNMLPRQIANCIKAGRQPSFEQADVSLYFSDIYNFSKISQLKRFRDDPKLIVEFLNGLYEELDLIVKCFQEKLYKVETINDSYLVMSGLPVRQDQSYLHAGFIAEFALFVLSRVNGIEIEGYPDIRVQIRIGIHSGTLAAGVIGKLNPRYCLFGDTVNFTSRLESTGKPFTIHTSINTVELLRQHEGLFKIVERVGKVTLKNRGEHQTYFVVGALYDSAAVSSAVKQKIGDDNKAYIRVLLPESDVYPEAGVHRTAEIAKERIERTHANISVNITLFQGLDSNEKLILDSEITKPLFQNAQENTYYVGLAHSKTALEMTTFLKMPTITFSTLFYIDEGTQVPINPQYRNSTKGLFNLLNHFKWYRVNFVFSHLPWYEETRKQLDASIKMLNNRRGSNSPTLDANIETRTKPSEEEYFYLNTHKMTEDDFREHIERSQTANIFIFVGHLCEFRQYIITALKYGFLKPGKIVIYLDMYGQMIEDKHDQGFTLSNVDCSNFFPKIPDYQDDFDLLLEAMKYVIVALTHWTDLPVNNVDRERFEEDLPLNTTLDYSGFDILMADSLQLLQEFITRGNKSEDLPTFIDNNQDSLSLYSGKLKYDNSVWRSLVCGVRFFHGNGFLEFMKWENTCNGIYCPEFTDTAKTVQWAGGDIPISRFEEKDSGPDSLLIILPLIFALFTIIAGAVFTTQMYKKRKCASSQKLWCLDQKNFEISKTHALQPKLSHGGVFPKRYQNVKNKSSRYKNCEVFMKEISKVNLNISNNYELTTEILKRVGGKADNVNFLIGVLEKANNVLLVQPFCSNGSLMDVMQQNPMNILDNFDFKLHVLMDVCKGMCFLHDTLNIPHANLKTSNCLVDSRWTVKVSDFDPNRVKQVVQPDTTDKEHVLAQKLWTAPELLSSKYTAQRGLKLCDVYSFGMISYHVLAGALPYHCKGEEGELAFSEIITRVKERSEPPFRPQLKLSDCNDNDDICKLIKECWSQRPNLRPTFGKIAQILDGWAMPGQSFGDFIASQMEEYSYGLDQKVKEMEEKLEHERSEFERLLQNMLPRQIANCIKAGRQPSFEQADVSLYFSDIYNFSKISQLKRFRDDPKLIVEFLNGLYEELDLIVKCFQEKLYKVETINDSYLVMSGLPVRQDQSYLHAGFIAEFALFVLSRVNGIEIEGYPDIRVQIRIGIHSGTLAAGVIGKLNPRYCLFGDTVNFTSRLESTGKPFTIHTSINTVELLRQHEGLFKIVERVGKVTLKNRGEHQTYFVVGMTGFRWDLPKETIRLLRRGDLASDDTDSLASFKTGDSVSMGYTSTTTEHRRKISNTTIGTEFSVTESSSAATLADARAPKLSCAVMETSVSQLMLLIDKMRRPRDEGNEFDGERPARRAFSEPDGGNFTIETDLKKQRMSTPFRKESDESLYNRVKDGHVATNLLPQIPEPSFSGEGEEDVAASCGSSSDLLSTLSDPLNDIELGIGDTTLSSVYNHDTSRTSSSVEDEAYTVPDRDDLEDSLQTPTDNGCLGSIKRRDTNKTLVAPSAYALSSAMGKKRYSCRKKLASSTNEHATSEGTESEDTRSYDLDHLDESTD